VEDEPKMAALLRRSLEREGYAVDLAGTGEEAIDAASHGEFDAIVLDVMIPPPDGFEVCRHLRANGNWTPVVMLTARGAVADRIAGLDAGANDYLGKPFALSELYARLRAATRHDPVSRPAILTLGDLVIDPARRTVKRGDTAIELSAKEFALLEYLMARVGTVISRQQLLQHVWGSKQPSSSNVVDVYVGYLRDKIDRPFGKKTIRTVRGVGFEVAPEDP
jgi:two-component system OmpR family response regulator